MKYSLYKNQCVLKAPIKTNVKKPLALENSTSEILPV